ncbi:MAG: MFS transporter, partial [Rhizobiaceae bacterium]
FLGGLTQRVGAGPTILFGMALTACAGILGGFSESGTFLLATRFLEGLGFVMTITSAPSLILAVAAPQNRKASLALWGMYMPLGTGLMLALSGPLLVWSDWRSLWWITASMIIIMILPTLMASRPVMERERQSSAATDGGAGGLRLAFRPGPMLLSLIFALYAAQYLIIVGFLPILLIELNGISAFTAATVCAVVVFLNAGGNALSGWFHNRNYRFSTLVFTGTTGMGICGALIFVPELDVIWRIAAAAGFSLIAGLVPSSLFSEMPRHAPKPSAVSAITGLLFQGAAIGQFLGPPAAAALVVSFGTWFAAIPLMAINAIAVAACVLCLEFQSKAPA